MSLILFNHIFDPYSIGYRPSSEEMLIKKISEIKLASLKTLQFFSDFLFNASIKIEKSLCIKNLARVELRELTNLINILDIDELNLIKFKLLDNLCNIIITKSDEEEEKWNAIELIIVLGETITSSKIINLLTEALEKSKNPYIIKNLLKALSELDLSLVKHSTDIIRVALKNYSGYFIEENSKLKYKFCFNFLSKAILSTAFQIIPMRYYTTTINLLWSHSVIDFSDNFFSLLKIKYFDTLDSVTPYIIKILYKIKISDFTVKLLSDYLKDPLGNPILKREIVTIFSKIHKSSPRMDKIILKSFKKIIKNYNNYISKMDGIIALEKFIENIILSEIKNPVASGQGITSEKKFPSNTASCGEFDPERLNKFIKFIKKIIYTEHDELIYQKTIALLIKLTKNNLTNQVFSELIDFLMILEENKEGQEYFIIKTIAEINQINIISFNSDKIISISSKILKSIDNKNDVPNTSYFTIGLVFYISKIFFEIGITKPNLVRILRTLSLDFVNSYLSYKDQRIMSCVNQFFNRFFNPLITYNKVLIKPQQLDTAISKIRKSHADNIQKISIDNISETKRTNENLKTDKSGQQSKQAPHIKQISYELHGLFGNKSQSNIKNQTDIKEVEGVKNDPPLIDNCVNPLEEGLLEPDPERLEQKETTLCDQSSKGNSEVPFKPQ